MLIKQFEDKNLSHYSFAILSDYAKQIVLIDPARNAKQYIDYAKDNNAEIIGIIETHPHADFVSSHLELHQSLGATIYASKDVGAAYPHVTFDEGQTIEIGELKFKALNTPGHSPDSISILLEQNNKQVAVFTGDTLFIGDCGRPDLREAAGKIQTNRNDLAKMMYHSLRDKLMILADDVLVYPAHGAGTLCGKNLSKENSSTIGEEKKSNWSLQPASEEAFVKNLLADQPFVPLYFPYNVEVNRNGAPAFQESISKIKKGNAIHEKSASDLDKSKWIIDTRKEDKFKKGHFAHSINLMENGKFETWLGSIIKPGEKFYLCCENEVQLHNIIERTAVIGYEGQVLEGFIFEAANAQNEILDVAKFKVNQNNYQIVDVRNTSEVKESKPFQESIHIPLAEIRNRFVEIPTDKPIVVHCAGGYRSAAASSLLKSLLPPATKVFDLGEAINQFK